MTTVVFRMEGDRITGFEARGHSGYAEAGAYIVCAAVTSAIRLVEATVNDVLGLAASVKVREQDVSISLHLPGGLSPTAESTCQSLLAGLMVYFSALHDAVWRAPRTGAGCARAATSTNSARWA